jgi:hypothetical protein
MNKSKQALFFVGPNAYATMAPTDPDEQVFRIRFLDRMIQFLAQTGTMYS